MKFLNTRAEAITHKVMIARFSAEQKYGKQTGNYCLTTSAGFRLAVASFDPDQIGTYLLTEMGISESVTPTPEGINIAVRNHHSFATIMRALQGSFRCIGLMHEDGRQVIQVLGFANSTAKSQIPTP